MSDKEGNLKMSENIPFIRIQSDWYDGIRNGEKVWISCCVQGEKPVYGNILSNGAKRDADFRIEADGSFTVELISKRSIKVTYPIKDVSNIFHAPFATYRNVHKKSIRCIDISAGGGLGISSSDDGTLNIWNTSDGVVRRCLEGHVNDVTHCRFFPSGVVALSGGIDMTLKIWSAENGSCPRTLVGHRAACSRDGTAKLWDCGRGECKQTLIKTNSAINACSLGIHKPNIPHGVSPMDEDDTESVKGKILLIAKEDGMLEGIDVQNSSRIFESSFHSAINTCGFVSENHTIAGCENGQIVQYDLRDTSSPVSVVSIGQSSVNHLQTHFENTVIARGDGSVQIVDSSKRGKVEMVQLTGPDADAIYRICCHGSNVYTACRDGAVRKYCLE